MFVKNLCVTKLEHLSKIAISSTILRSVNLEHLLNCDFDGANSPEEAIASPYNVKELLIVDKIASKVYHLPLPERFLDECRELIGAMGMETIKYFQNLPLSSLWMTLPYDPKIYFGTIEWNDKGLVNETKMARNVLSRPFKNPKAVFELACNYCFEDLVTKFWTPNMVSKPKFKRFALSQTTYKPLTDYNFALHYWNQFILGKLDTFENALRKNLPDRSLNEIMCLWSLGQSNSFAFDYFWAKIDEDDREKLILQFFKDSIRHNLNPQTIFNLFSSLTEEQILSVTNDRLFYEGLLNLTLNFPWLDYFSPQFELCRDVIPENEYKHLLFNLSKKVSLGIYANSYRRSFELVWNSSPNRIKTSVLNYDYDYPLFWMIFENGDLDVIKIVVKNCDESTFETIFFSSVGLKEMQTLLFFKNIDIKMVLNILENIFNDVHALRDYKTLLLKKNLSTKTKYCFKRGKLNVSRLDAIFKALTSNSNDELIVTFKRDLIETCLVTVLEIIATDTTDLKSLEESLTWFFPNEEEFQSFKSKISRDKLLVQNLCKELVVKRQCKFIKLFLLWVKIPIKEFKRDFALSKAGLEFIYSLGNDKQLSGAIEFFLTEKNLLFEFINRFQEKFSWNRWHEESYKNIWRILESKSCKMK